MPSQRTYGSRNRIATTLTAPSSPVSGLSSSPPPTPVSRPSKRPFVEITKTPCLKENFPPTKKLKTLHKSDEKPKKSLPKTKAKAKGPGPGQTKLTQLHFAVERSPLRTCPKCEFTYTIGAPDDESLHKSHCSRVQQGMDWGREEEKDRFRSGKDTVTEVKTDVKLKNSKKRGRIVSFPADIGGKIGSKLHTLLQTINLALSAPDLPPTALQCSKAYLFLVPHETIPSRERIIGCGLAQRISTAMAIVPSPSSDEPKYGPDAPPPTATYVSVDPSTELFCDPTPLPTLMGIPRIFVPTTHRRLGVAQHLLSAAAETFIYGCPLDPKQGQVAFSQPTGMGQKVMRAWGQGGVRIYEE